MGTERLKIEKIGGSLIIKIPKYFKDKYKVKENQEILIDFDKIIKK